MSDSRVWADMPAGSLAEGTYVPAVLPAGVRCAPREVDQLATEHLVINMGPQHPSTHGVLRILLEVDGEEIICAEACIGYLHRGIEKLAEHRRYAQLATLMDRGDYISGMHNELAVALAAEQLIEAEVPEKANWIRTLVCELNRISSHLLWYGPMGLDTGAMGQFLYAIRDREAILDIFDAIAGQRMMFNYVRPGGVVLDLPEGIESQIARFLDDFEVHIEEHDELLGGNEIFQMRTQGIGTISREMALAYSLTGPNLRASGIAYDVRRERPYAAYEAMRFDVPTAQEGDVYARYEVRVEEMRQSARICRQCLEGMPEGPYMAKIPKVLRPPAGETYAAVESPRGELGVYLISDGTDKPYRLRYRPPALYALQASEQLLPGTLIADGVVIVGSVDVVLGEIDR